MSLRSTLRPSITIMPFTVAVALALAGCDKAPLTATSPSPIKCTVSVALTSGTLDAAGGAGAITVATQAECSWTASTDASWISGLSPTVGQGPGEIRFQVAANPSPTSRSGQVALNGVGARVTQSGAQCQFELTPRSQSIAATAVTGTVAIGAASGCTWNATSNDPWLTLTSARNGNGDGTIAYSVAANAGVARLGTVSISDQTFVVTQQAPTAPSCQYSIQPSSQSISQSGGTTNVGITADAGCSWTAASNVSWLAVAGVGTGAGNGSVAISVTANTGSLRVGTMTIAGQTFTVTEAGSCAVSLNPSGQSIGAGGIPSASVAVTTVAGCGWNATTADSWVTLTSPASGSGNGAVTFSVAANAGPARSGTLVISGQTHTITQAGTCATSISPVSQSIGAGPGAGTSIAVSAVPGCAWTATTATNWIAISAPAGGSGNGTVNFSVAANSGGARSGTITIAGQTHTVNQAGSCAPSISPASQSVSPSAGAGAPIAVTTAAGCAWTATTPDSWIAIAAPASGTGNGTVNFSVAATSGAARSGTIVVAGQTHTVNQASGCTFTINPTSRNFNKNAVAASNVTVTTAAGCAWTATSNDSWITIGSGASGTGNGTVTFGITKNNGSDPRVGTITIAGRTFTITQDDH